MPEDDGSITEPENSNTTLAKILGDALTRDWEGRRAPESGSPGDEEALPGTIPREPGEGGRVGNDVETTPAEPDEALDAVIEGVLQSIGDIDLEADWRAFHAEVTAAQSAATVEAIRSGFLRALEDGTVTLPAGARDALKTKDELPRVGVAFEYRADSDDLREPTIALGDPADWPVTVVVDGADDDVQPSRRVPFWAWLAVAAAVIAIAAFLALGDSEPDASVGSGGVVSPVSTATAGGVATVAPTALATTTPAAARTPQAVQIPTLRICPDGSSFSGYELPDGSFLDAATNEVRVCPPPPN